MLLGWGGIRKKSTARIPTSVQKRKWTGDSSRQLKSFEWVPVNDAAKLAGRQRANVNLAVPGRDRRIVNRPQLLFGWQYQNWIMRKQKNIYCFLLMKYRRYTCVISVFLNCWIFALNIYFNYPIMCHQYGVLGFWGDIIGPLGHWYDVLIPNIVLMAGSHRPE